jgi:RNA polymerase primary sigma factor
MTATKTASSVSALPSRRRAARLVTKAQAHRDEPRSDAGEDAQAAEDDLAHEAFEADAGARASRDVRADTTYLSLYFRDMAQLDVLRPEQEFASAREIEALEIALWQVLFGFCAGIEVVVNSFASADVALSDLAELRGLRRCGSESSRGRASAERFDRAVAKAARKVRAVDPDRLYVDAALETVSRLARGIGTRGSTPEAIVSAAGFPEWIHRIAVAERAAGAARNAFVKANLRLVVSIARRFNHGRMALADLIQEGNLGLIKAVQRYDYRRGFRFSTYASWWIRHAISRALADKGREIRLPVHMIDAHHRIAKARRELTAQLGRQPSTEEVSQSTQIPGDKIEKMRCWMLEQPLSMDRPVGDEEGRTLGEVLEDPDREEISFVATMEQEAVTSGVSDLLGELRPIEADILRQRFGLGTEQELTLKEIGDRYKLSRERIRQLQEQALCKMRRALQRRDLF